MNTQRNYDLALNALGDPTRRAIFEKLEHGPLSVVHIAKGLAVTRPAVSQHLKVLRDARLVTVARQGTRSFYAIDLQGLRNIRAYLDRFWADGLDRFKKLAEETEKSKQKQKPKK